MKVFKKKLVQRLSCVCCAVAFAIFSVFSICDFSRSKKSEVISASAEESFSNLPRYSYDIIIPKGLIFRTYGSLSQSSSSYFNASNTIYRFKLNNSLTGLGASIVSLGIFYSVLSPVMVYDSENNIFTLTDTLVFPIDIYNTDSNVLEKLNSLGFEDGLYSYHVPEFSTTMYCYFMSGNSSLSYTNYGIVGDLDSFIYIRSSSNFSSLDLENSYNNGYQIGYTSGVQDTREEAFNDGYNQGYDKGSLEGFASGVEQGLETGYNDGFINGKEEAEEKNKRGLFASFESIEVVAYDSSDKWLYSIEADYGVNAVSFNTAFLEYEYMIEYENFNPAYYKIWFGTEHGYEYEIPLEMLEIIAYGNPIIFGEQNSFFGQGSNYYTQTWRQYAMYFDTSQGSEGYPLVIEYNNNDPHLSRARLNNFGVKVKDLEYLRNLQFVATSGYYSQGYTQGVVDGYANGLTDGEKVGYNKGYEYGENVGYNRGVGDSGEYTFLGLFTAVVDAPIKAFLGLLDFEILGMDMQKFFLSILTAALCIAVYRLFSGSAT